MAKFRMTISDTVSAVISLDTGKRGTISMGRNVFARLKKVQPDLSYTYMTGEVASGIFGTEKDTAFQARALDIQMGELTLDTLIVAFRRKHNGFWGMVNIFFARFREYKALYLNVFLVEKFANFSG